MFPLLLVTRFSDGIRLAYWQIPFYTGRTIQRPFAGAHIAPMTWYDFQVTD